MTSIFRSTTGTVEREERHKQRSQVKEHVCFALLIESFLSCAQQVWAFGQPSAVGSTSCGFKQCTFVLVVARYVHRSLLFLQLEECVYLAFIMRASVCAYVCLYNVHI